MYARGSQTALGQQNQMSCKGVVCSRSRLLHLVHVVRHYCNTIFALEIFHLTNSHPLPRRVRNYALTFKNYRKVAC